MDASPPCISIHPSDDDVRKMMDAASSTFNITEEHDLELALLIETKPSAQGDLLQQCLAGLDIDNLSSEDDGLGESSLCAERSYPVKGFASPPTASPCNTSLTTTLSPPSSVRNSSCPAISFASYATPSTCTTSLTTTLPPSVRCPPRDSGLPKTCRKRRRSTCTTSLTGTLPPSVRCSPIDSGPPKKCRKRRSNIPRGLSLDSRGRAGLKPKLSSSATFEDATNIDAEISEDILKTNRLNRMKDPLVSSVILMGQLPGGNSINYDFEGEYTRLIELYKTPGHSSEEVVRGLEHLMSRTHELCRTVPVDVLNATKILWYSSAVGRKFLTHMSDPTPSSTAVSSDSMGCAECCSTVANVLCGVCWTAGKCSECFDKGGCRRCNNNTSYFNISFKSHKVVCNRFISSVLSTKIPEGSSWLEYFGDGGIGNINEDGLVKAVSRGYTKGVNYDAAITDMLLDAPSVKEMGIMQAQLNAHRAHYLAKCVPRVRSDWKVKNVVCSACSLRFANCITLLGGKFEVTGCVDCVPDSRKYSPGYNASGERVIPTFCGGSYFQATYVSSSV